MLARDHGYCTAELRGVVSWAPCSGNLSFGAGDGGSAQVAGRLQQLPQQLSRAQPDSRGREALLCVARLAGAGWCSLQEAEC